MKVFTPLSTFDFTTSFSFKGFALDQYQTLELRYCFMQTETAIPRTFTQKSCEI